MNSLVKLIILISLTYSTNGFSQQREVKSITHSSITKFSDIIKYDQDHQDLNKQSGRNGIITNEHKVQSHNLSTDSSINNKDRISEKLTDERKQIVNTADATATDFSGITMDVLNPKVPPDVNGAVGPNHIMTTLNSDVKIQSLTGATISTVHLNSFWASVGNNNSAFNPKILYEPYNNRWIFSTASQTSLMIGVSQSSDPTGTWYLYSIPVNSGYLDFQCMGYNKDWIVVTGDLHLSSGGNGGTKVYIFKKADLYSHASAPQYTLLTPPDASGIYPVTTLDNTISSLYLLQTYAGNNAGVGKIKLYTISGSIGSESISPGIYFTTPNPWNIRGTQMNTAPQQGSNSKISLNDDRIASAVYRNGSIWGVHTIYLPADVPTRSAVQWWQVNTSGVILQRGRIDDASGDEHFGVPSIAVNVSNDALIGYSKFSSSIYPSACYALRTASDPINTFQPENVFKSGLATYNILTQGINRWGGYSATMTDPSGLDFWTIQEYAETHSGSTDRWGTWWAKVTTPGDTCRVVVSISPYPEGDICSGTSVTLTASPTNPGSSPSYQWKLNGTNVGTNSPTYTNSGLMNGDQIKCTMTSNLTCATGNPALSNTITMVVNVVDDYDACTLDFCDGVNGVVNHTTLPIDDGFPCTADGCNSTTGVFHNPVNCGPTLNSNILIGGLYTAGGLMLNTGSTGLLNALDSVVHPDKTDEDTIVISAMNPAYPYTEVFRQSAILKTNGEVTVIFGSEVITGNYYYLKINHRSSVETWSAEPVQLNSNTTYSFSSSASQVFANNILPTYDNYGFAIISGDINQDGSIDLTDYLILDPDIQNGNGGYVPSDLNGDLAVDITDYNLFEPNIQNGEGCIAP